LLIFILVGRVLAADGVKSRPVVHRSLDRGVVPRSPPRAAAASASPEGRPVDEPPEPFHLYDAAMRLWAESGLPDVAAWLEPSLAGLPPAAFARMPASFKASVLHGDLLIQAGPRYLLHVEYETSPGPALVRRMYEYRGRIMHEHPGIRLIQYVVVLGAGTVSGHDDLAANGFALELRVVYLRNHDPAEYLRSPVSAPFAALARGTPAERERSLARALTLLRTSGHPSALSWRQAAETLARLRLDPATIHRIGKEIVMNIQERRPLVDFYLDSEVGQDIMEIGRSQGRSTGRAELVLALLRVRFPQDPRVQAVAEQLTSWDDAAVAEAIARADSLDVLVEAIETRR
jgi:hypothetical protein